VPIADDDEIRDYRGLIAALTEILGGKSATNKRFFAWLAKAKEGDDDREHRELFGPKIDVTPATAFRLGQFFNQIFGWCSGPAFLYAANKLDTYVGVLSGMRQLGAPTSDLFELIELVDDVVAYLPIDKVRIQPTSRSVSIGAMLVDSSRDVVALWNDVKGGVPRAFFDAGYTDNEICSSLTRRQSARARLRSSAETNQAAVDAFEKWPTRPPNDIDGDNELRLAYALARTKTIESELRRFGVKGHLWNWLYEALGVEGGDD
jgi:hypothetical protein